MKTAYHVMLIIYLTQHMHFSKLTDPTQVPENFKIRPFPKNICSFITSILQLLTTNNQWFLPKKPSELSISNACVLSCLASESEKSTSKNFLSSSKTFSCQPSLKLCEKQLSLEEIKMNWWKQQSVPHYHMWNRHSGQTTGHTPYCTLTVKHALSSKNSSEDTPIMMAPS